MIALLYSLIHLLLGALAAVWTYKRLSAGGYDKDGCLLWFAAFVAFLFWPFALAVLIVVWVIDQLAGSD